MENTALYSARTHKLGAMLNRVRSAERKSVEECASAMGVSVEEYESFERGEYAPSLPQLEIMAYFLQVPLESFWEQEVPAGEESKPASPNLTALLNIRNRVVGALLRKRRVERGLSVAELAEKVGLTAELLHAYETGRAAAPVPVLEMLSEALAWTIFAFQADHGPIGDFFVQVRSAQDFKDLSPELQKFVTQPVNRPFLELALRLSEMEVGKLRNVAEGLLEITL